MRRTLLVCVALFAGVTALYWRAVGFGFIDFDDPQYFRENHHVNQGWRWSQLPWCFQAGYAANWHPLTWMSHMLDSQWFGVTPGGPHAVNLIIHAANSVLLFLVLQKMTKAPWRSAMVAALFAVHPLHVESVAWISERKDVLSTLFWFLAIWAYSNYAARPSRWRYGLTLLFFVLGLMAKPMVVTLPLVLLLLDWWPLGRLNSKMACWTAMLEKVPFFVVGAGSAVLTMIAQRRAISSLETISLGNRVANALAGYLMYTVKLFWPANLSFIYPLDPLLPRWLVFLAVLFLIVFSVGALWRAKSNRYFGAGWLWYLVTLLPVIGLVQVGSQAMADRYSYIPSIGIFIIVCWLAGDIAMRWPATRAIFAVAGVASVMALACVMEKQLGYWKNSNLLFEHALEIDPNNYLAHSYRGAYLRDRHELPEAEAECRRAVEILPDAAMGHVYLSSILTMEGKRAEAIAEMQAALSYDPDSFVARVNMGDIYFSEGRYDAAAEEYSKALAVNPDEPTLFISIGRMLRLENKLPDAESNLEKALSLNPSSVDAHYELAVVFTLQHKFQDAIAEYQTALQLRPNFSDALNNLAWILATNPDPKIRNGAEAVEYAGHACELTGHQQAFKIGTLAAAYAEAGQFNQAVAAAQEAHDVALAHGEKNVAEAQLKLKKLYQSQHAYRDGN